LFFTAAVIVVPFAAVIIVVAVDAVDTAAVDTTAVDTAAVDTAAVDTAAVDTAAVDTDAVDTAAVDTAAVDTDAVDTAAVVAFVVVIVVIVNNDAYRTCRKCQHKLGVNEKQNEKLPLGYSWAYLCCRHCPLILAGQRQIFKPPKTQKDTGCHAHWLPFFTVEGCFSARKQDMNIFLNPAKTNQLDMQ
jgi:hypothetical protein